VLYDLPIGRTQPVDVPFGTPIADAIRMGGTATGSSYTERQRLNQKSRARHVAQQSSSVQMGRTSMGRASTRSKSRSPNGRHQRSSSESKSGSILALQQHHRQQRQKRAESREQGLGHSYSQQSPSFGSGYLKCNTGDDEAGSFGSHGRTKIKTYLSADEEEEEIF